MSARTAECTCGGLIVAIEGEEELAVRAHQQERIHVIWRANGGMERAAHGRSPGMPVVGVSPDRPVRPAPTDAVEGLRRALGAQQVTGPLPADWHYRRGQRVPVAAGRV
ncbi:MAG: hypothetical protein KF809_14955 [Chloroflexi bacterium]|nr:hypothetical protein [Chloroflexota bacterium]